MNGKELEILKYRINWKGFLYFLANFSKKDYRESEDELLLSYYRINDNGVYRHGPEADNLEYAFIWDCKSLEERIKNEYNGIILSLDPYFKILPK